MITLLLKLGFRSFRNHKFYGLINIAGLMIGLLSFSMIMLYVIHERSFDEFHSNGDRIYRVISHSRARTAGITPYVWGHYIMNDLAEIEEYTTIQPLSLTIKDGDRVSAENNVFAVDSGFFGVFNFPILQGNKKDFLGSPSKMVITPETALRYFGQENPIGKSLEVNVYGEFVDFEVEGVVLSPQNSHIQFDFLLPVQHFRKNSRDTIAYDSWSSHFVFTYVLASENINIPRAREDLKALLGRHGGPKIQEAYTPDLQRLNDIYLKSDLEFDFKPRGNDRNLSILSLVAVGILAMAIINFINITTAQSLRRIKDVGVRKIFGSSRRMFLLQFIGESAFASFIALMLSCALLYVLLPYYNILTEKHFSAATVFSIGNLLRMVGITLLVAIIGGLYPALLLSSYRPINTLRSRSGGKLQRALARKVLVTVQFSLAVVLLVSTGVIFVQVNFMRTIDSGFDKENVLVIEDGGEVSSSAIRTERLRQELLKASLIQTLSASSTYPGQQTWAMRFYPDGFEDEEGLSVSTVFADHDYLKTYGVEIMTGRDFERTWVSDSSSLLLNESAIELFASKDPSFAITPLEHRISWTGFGGTTGKSPVVGVFKNFNFESLRREIKPLIIKIEPLFFTAIQIKLSAGSTTTTIGKIEKTWKSLFPEVPFAYSFVDDQFATYFRADEKLVDILKLFSILSISIAVLGLFGLASFMTIEKSREMGIRKVTGASEQQLVTMLSWMFLKLILLANVIAFPISYYLMSSWLEEFVFRIQMPYVIFVLAILTTVLVSLLTVYHHSAKTARVNPATVLTCE